MDLLEKYLYELDNVIRDNDSVILDAIIDNIEKIVNDIDREVDDELAMHLLFVNEKPLSLLQFCCNTEFSNITVKLLKFLASYIKKLYVKGYDRIVNQYGDIILLKLLTYFTNAESKSIKASALLPIKYILRYNIIKNTIKYQSHDGTILRINNLSKTYKLLTSIIVSKKENKSNKSLKSEIFRTLGLLVGLYPNSKETSEVIESIIIQIFLSLHTNFTIAKEPEFSCMAGALSCLDRCMFDHEDKVMNVFNKLAKSAKVEVDGQELLWKYLLQSVSTAVNENVHRYELSSKALRVISHHSLLFQSVIISYAKASYDVVEKCRKEKNSPKKISKHCTDALCAILTQLAIGVATNESGRNPESNNTADTLYSLCSEFLGRLKNSPEEINLAVMCIAAIVPGIAKFEKIAQTQTCLGNIIDSLLKAADFKKELQAEENEYAGKYYTVSKPANFLRAFAYIFSTSDVKPNPNVFAYIVSASKIVVRGYNILQTKYRLMFCTSICMITHALSKQECLQEMQVLFLGDFLYEVILNTVKRSDVIQSEIEEEESTAEIQLGETQVNSYLELWYDILVPSSNKETLNALNLAGPPEYSSISKVLFDRIMLIAIDIIKKLDLRYAYNSIALVNDFVEPMNMFDQDILLNLTSFFEKLIPFYSLYCKNTNSNILAKWIPIFLSECITLSNLYPMVSALYRMMKCFLSLSAWEDSMNEIQHISGSIKEYLVSLQPKLIRFQDELLSSSLSMIFNTPLHILDINYLIDCVEIALRTGIEVEEGVRALHKCFITHSKQLKDRLNRILPILSKYLHSSNNLGHVHEVEYKRVSIRKRVEQKLNTVYHDNLQLTILRFLGRIGGLNQGVLEKPNEVIKAITSWNLNECLFVNLPMPHEYDNRGISKLTIALDRIIPRLLELCSSVSTSMSANERQIRIFAAETLHGLILLMIGVAATRPNKQEKSAFESTYKKIFPATISLSACPDNFCRKLFSTLLFQIIHWFSKQQAHPDETKALIDSLISGLGNETDSGVREQCASCIAEFFRWFIKQRMKKEVAEQPASADSVIKELFSMISHPSEVKRLGAAITFKNIYKDFREESSLINRYALSIIYNLLLSLRLTSSNVFQDEAYRVIDIYTTIVLKSIEKKDDCGSLLLVNSLRDFPLNLEELVNWSWSNCANPNLYFRRGCMNCFDILVRFLKNPFGSRDSTDTKELQEFFTEDRSMIGSIVKLLESSLNDMDKEFESSKSMSVIGGIADFLRWTILKKYLKLSELSSSKTNGKKRKSDNFDGIDTAMQCFASFIERCSLIDNNALPKEQESTIMELDHHDEGRNLSELRSEVFRRILEFIIICIDNNTLQECEEFFVSSGLWNHRMHSLIIRSLMRSKYDNLFPSKNISSMNMDLKSIISTVLNNIGKIENTSIESTNSFKFSINDYIGKFLQKLKDPKTVDEDDILSILNVTEILDQNNLTLLILETSRVLELKDVGKRLFIFALNSSLSDDPNVIKICATILQYTLSLNCISFISNENEMSFLSSLSSPNGFYYYKRHGKLLGKTIIDRTRESRMQDLKIIPFLFKGACSLANNDQMMITNDSIDSNERDPILAMTLYTLDLLVKEFSFVSMAAITSIVSNCVASLSATFPPIISSLIIRLIQLDSKLPPDLRNNHLRDLVCRNSLNALSETNRFSLKSIVEQMGLLPYLVNGTTSNCPRPEAQFHNDSQFNEDVIGGLEEMVAAKFPLDWEFHDPNSVEGENFIYLFKAYLRAIIESGAVSLLKPLFPIFREGSKNRYYRKILEMFHFLIENTETDGDRGFVNVDLICSFCFDTFESDYEDYDIKELLCNHLFLPLLRKCTSDSLSRLIVSSIKLSNSVSKSDLTLVKKLVDSISCQYNFSQKSKLFVCSVVYSTFDILYSRCHLDSIKSQITKGYNPNAVKDNELTVIITKCITDYCLNTEVDTDDAETLKISQRMYSAAFSCIATIISKTQSNLGFYDKILFRENKYWCKGIDCSLHYFFQKALAKPFKTEYISNASAWKPTRKKKRQRGEKYFASSSLNPDFIYEHKAETTTSQNPKRPRMSSVSSTLDPPEFSQQYEDEYSNPQQSIESEDTALLVKGFDDQTIAIEMNDLNQQMTMKSMVRAILRMSILQGDGNKTAMPEWVNQLNQRLANFNNKKNVRLFVLRLLLNQPVADIVAPWAKDLLPSIIKCSLEDLCNSDAGDGFHYFLKDVVFAFTHVWKEARPTNEACTNAGRFITYLIKVAFDVESEVFKENRLAICNLVSIWLSHDSSIRTEDILPPRFRLNLEAIKELLHVEVAPTGGAHGRADSQGSIAVKKLLAAFEILIGLVHSGYNLISVRECTNDGFINSILQKALDHINTPRKEVSESASKFCGIVLCLLKNTIDEEFKSTYLSLATDAVNKKSSSKSKFNGVASSVFAIVSFYPEFLTKKLCLVMLTAFNNLEPRAQYEFLSACAHPNTCKFAADDPLDVPEAISHFLPSLLGNFTTVYIPELKKSIPMIQLKTLMILKKYSKELKLNVIELMLTQKSNSSNTADAFSFVTSEKADVSVRKEAFSLLLSLISEHPDIGIYSISKNKASNDALAIKARKLHEKARGFVLKGLVDPDDIGMHNVHNNEIGNEGTGENQGIRKMIFKFFDEQYGLSKNPFSRLESLMTDLYNPQDNGNQKWLHYSTYLMLSLSLNCSNEISEPLFKENLSDALTFKPMVFSSERTQSSVSSLTPLFSLDRTQNQFFTQSDDINRESGYVRGTQEVSWTQTQAFNVNPTMASLSQIAEGPEMSAPKGLPNYLKKGMIQQTVPKRFISRTNLSQTDTNKSTIVRSFPAGYSNERKTKKKAVLYRTYQEGELPDIRIKLSDICSPLQGLCLSDPAIASGMLNLIISGLFGHAYCESNDLDAAEAKSLRSGLKNILQRTSGQDTGTNFATVILSSCLRGLKEEENLIKNLNLDISSHSDLMLNMAPELVADFSVQSSTHHAAIQFLEEQLLFLKEKKNSTVDENLQTSILMQLSSLYESIGDTDVLLSLVAKICPNDLATNKALDSEREGDYLTALRIYNHLISTDYKKPVNCKVWSERSLNCQKELCRWPELYAGVEHVIRNETSNDDTPIFKLLTHSSNYSKDFVKRIRFNLIPNYISSLIHMMSSADPDSNNDDELSNFMNTVFSTVAGSRDKGNIREWIEANHAIDIANYFASKGEWTRVPSFIEKSYLHFLQRYSAISPCSIHAKKNLLQGLQQIVELEDATSFYMNRQHYNPSPKVNESQFSSLITTWASTFPNENDSIFTWDSIFTSRYFALRINNNAGSYVFDKSSISLLSDLHVKASKASIIQSNIYAAKYQIDLSKNIKKRTMDGTEAVYELYEYEAVYEYCMKKISIEAPDSSNIPKLFQKNYEFISNTIKRFSERPDPSSANLLELELMRARLLTEWYQHDKEYSRNQDTIASSSRRRPEDAFNIYYDIIVKFEESLTNSSMVHRDIPKLKEVYGKLARLCNDSFLKDIDLMNRLGKKHVTKVTVNAYVNGLKLCDRYCRDHILDFVKIVHENPETVSVLSSNMPFIPAWVFLRYGAQLVGRLDEPEGDVVVLILEHVAKYFPKALYYQFKISSENFRQAKQRTRKLERLLMDHIMDCFVEALEGLHHPFLRWLDGVKLIKHQKTAEAFNCFTNLCNKIVEFQWDKVGNKIGTYNREFATKFKPYLVDNKELRSFDYWEKNKRSKIDKDLQEITDNFKNNQSRIIEKHFDRVALGQFSQWLEDFDWIENRIEVPGQYANDRTCDPSSHSVILGIDSNLLVMKSKTRPKRIIFRGNNGKDHMFLVKGGEDLRNDERVEQLFILMNSFLPYTGDVSSPNEAPMRARTFTVVPMTTKVGLLEWVKDTVPLKSIISEEMTKDKNFLKENTVERFPFDIGNIVASRKRQAWIGNKDMTLGYFNLYKQKSSKEAIDFWNKEICPHVPDDFIRRRLVRMSLSSEAFITIRQNFACTLAASNMWGYIIGLGDRHLENLLLDVTSGDIVQIDFGCCFGMGTDKLSVPELLPFRLTRNLERVLQPLDGRGLYRHYMLKCLLACKDPENSKELINELEIYINDPIVDWQKRSLSHMTDTEIEHLKSAESWEPRLRVASSIKKLKGTHPVSILIEDLSRHQVKNMYNEKSTLTIMRKMLEDVCQLPIEEDKTVSVGEQIDTLISIATSPVVLVRQWQGLETWL